MNKGIRPTARRDGLVIQHLDDETLVYDLELNKAYCLNRTASLVWQECDGQKSPEEIRRSICLGGVEVDTDIVNFALGQLASEKLLEGNDRFLTSNTSRSRRETIRRLGMVSVALLPIVASVVAPPAAHAASCLVLDSPCITSAQCCTGCC